MHGISKPPVLLALDTGSPVVSVALARGDRTLAERRHLQARSSEQLLQMIEAVLHEGGVALADLDGVAALRGPGSFTGLRVGLATALGFHQALGLAVIGLPTLQALAACATSASLPPVGAVDALRGEYFVQRFRAAGGGLPHPQGNASLIPAAGMVDLAPCTLVGFGLGRLREAADWPREAEILEPASLAPAVARLAAHTSADWDPALLTSPLYLRPPAVTAWNAGSGS